MLGLSWQALGGIGLFVLLFGFLPGFTLRLLVLVYPKDDPRRRELVAELYVHISASREKTPDEAWLRRRESLGVAATAFGSVLGTGTVMFFFGIDLEVPLPVTTTLGLATGLLFALAGWCQVTHEKALERGSRQKAER